MLLSEAMLHLDKPYLTENSSLIDSLMRHLLPCWYQRFPATKWRLCHTLFLWFYCCQYKSQLASTVSNCV